MTSNFLKEKLTESAKASPAFVTLPLEKQAEIISSLENATDQQIVEAIKAFEEDRSNLDQSNLAKQQKEQRLAEQAASLENDLKEAQNYIKNADQASENNSHELEIKNLEYQLSELNKPVPVKRKKFLGIF